jgi:hypothetical protein
VGPPRIEYGHYLARVSEDVGHSNMTVTYRIYTRVIRLDGDERDRLRALVEGSEWAPADAASAGFGAPLAPARELANRG